ncbi:MAG: diphthine--ammonia ligase [Planctomycetes bacterium]|nr:diphthine--ammonia ligase [Planctomycetota bacterium]
MSYITSWSGGKDSCLACYKAMLDGYDISYILNSISEEYKRVRFHGLEAKLIQLQAKSLGIPLLQKETTDDRYEQEFKEAIQSLIPNGIKGMVFGDIYLEGAKEWVEKVCGDLGIEAVEPLWGKETEEVLTEFIDAGFEAIIVGAQSEFVGKEWIGRYVNKDFMKYLKDKGADICGENGEYHTLVVNGPIFSKRIEITESETIRRNGYWFLDTRQYRLVY